MYLLCHLSLAVFVKRKNNITSEITKAKYKEKNDVYERRKVMKIK